MKYLVLNVISFLFALLVVAGSGRKPQTYVVVISDMKFRPEVIRVHPGDTIIWKNLDLVDHCITEFPSKAWTSSLLETGQTWKKPVEKSCDYYCAFHVVMKGKIVVR